MYYLTITFQDETQWTFKIDEVAKNKIFYDNHNAVIGRVIKNIEISDRVTTIGGMHSCTLPGCVACGNSEEVLSFE